MGFDWNNGGGGSGPGGSPGSGDWKPEGPTLGNTGQPSVGSVVGGAAATGAAAAGGSLIGGLGGASGIISGLGSVFGSILNSQSQAGANATNLQIARESFDANQKSVEQQEAFQQMMSSTAYQRATEDMRKAGINPMLAFSQGGASTPSGGSASMSAPTMQATNPGDALKSLAPALSTALNLKNMEKDLEAKDANIALTEAAKVEKDTQADLNITNATVAANQRKRLEYLNRQESNAADVSDVRSLVEKGQALKDLEWLPKHNFFKRSNEASGAVNNASEIFRKWIPLTSGPSYNPWAQGLDGSWYNTHTGEIR